MPAVLQGVATTDGYTDECAFQPDKNTSQIVFVGQGNDYYVQAYKLNPRDPQSSPISDGVERLYPGGGGDSFTGPIAGCSFRSAVAGASAEIFGQQAFKTDIISASPIFGGGTFANPVGGGMTLIQTQILSATTPSITFSAIPASFTHLQLLYLAGSDQAVEEQLRARLNADTGANYDYEFVESQNGAVAGGGTTGATAMTVGVLGTAAGFLAGNMLLPFYNATIAPRTAGVFGGAAANNQAGAAGGSWGGVGPVTSLSLLSSGGNLLSGSGFSLYGF